MFDMPMQHWPARPTIDRDAAALAVQKELGRPLSWGEYCLIWNAISASQNLPDHEFLTGERDFASDEEALLAATRRHM